MANWLFGLTSFSSCLLAWCEHVFQSLLLPAVAEFTPTATATCATATATTATTTTAATGTTATTGTTAITATTATTTSPAPIHIMGTSHQCWYRLPICYARGIDASRYGTCSYDRIASSAETTLKMV